MIKPPRLKRLFNRPEAIVYGRLAKTCEPRGSKVFGKVRVADVLPIDGSGVPAAAFSFALKSHFDFVVVDSKDAPIFAVEFDGPSHQDPVQQQRDEMKDELCKDFELPLLRVRYAHLEVYRTYDLLSWIVEQWFLQRAFDDAQEKGHIPYDESFDPTWIMGGKGERPFPMWLSLDAQNGFRRLQAEGRILDGYPSFSIGMDDRGTRHGIFWLQKAETEWLYVTTGARAQNFPMPLSDLVSQVGIMKLYAVTERALAGSVEPESREVLDEQLERHKRFQLLMYFGHTKPGS